MRNLKFLIGALGGAFGGYMLSNKKLRKQLSEAKDANEAAKILGKEIQKSGKGVAKDIREWIDSEEFQQKFDLAKGYLSGKGELLKKEVTKSVKKVGKTAKKKVNATYRKARKAVREKVG